MADIGTHLIAGYMRLTSKRDWSSADRTEALAREPKAKPDPPRRITRRHQITERTVAGFRCYTVEPAAERSLGKAAMYLHGGAYVNEIDPFHWRFIARMADAGVRVAVPIYGLAPQHSFPEAYEFVTAAYLDLIARHDPAAVTLVGDSAGGGLAIGLARSLADAGHPLPRRVIALAPWLEITGGNPAIDAVEPHDPWLARAGSRRAGELWMRDGDPRDYRVSPLFVDLNGLPPITIYQGTRDITEPDAVDFAARARDGGADVSLTIVGGALHVYPLLPTRIGRRAAAEIVSAIAR